MTSPSRAARVRKRLERGPVEVWTGRLEDEPAVRAWRELGAGPRPARLEPLRRRRKSVVYRLPGVGVGGSYVIAKRGLWQDALDERAVYEALSELPVARLAYYGFVAGAEREYGWLFMEDADSEPSDPQLAAHRQVSTRWLAQLHTAKAFCSGADLGNVMSKEGAKTGDPLHNYADLLKRIASFPKPTVAKVNGYCLAGGTGFMLACDIGIARDDAKFGTPEVNVGLFPMMIGALIFRNVPRKKAMEMVLLGEKISSAEALDMGVITRSVPFAKLDEEVSSVLKSLATKSPIGLKIGKEAFYAMDSMPFEKALDYLCGKLREVASTEDAVEGITAFIQKRPPVFKGR